MRHAPLRPLIVLVSETGMHSQIVGQDGKRGRALPLLQLTQLDEAVEKGLLDVVLKD